MNEIKYPVEYSSLGTYINDADGKMIADVRGWGWIQKLENPEELQDSIGKAIADSINRQAPAESYICCEELGNALGDHNGLHSQTIGSMTSDSMDSIIMYKGGDYKIRNRIVVQYCPFCGKPRRRASEYKKETV